LLASDRKSESDVNGRAQKRDRASDSSDSPAFEMLAFADAIKNSKTTGIRLAPHHDVVDSIVKNSLKGRISTPIPVLVDPLR